MPAGKAAASEGRLAEEIGEDAEVLRATRDEGTHPDDPNPENAAYRLASRMTRIDEKATREKLIEGGFDAADRIGKIDKAGQAGFRWLSYLMSLFG